MKRTRISMSAGLRLAVLLALLTTGTSCSKSGGGKNGNNPPKVSYVSISANTITAGSNSYIDLSFNFSDKDGDLSNAASASDFDIYVVDKRNDSTIGYYFPKDITNSSDENEGISGNCIISLFGSNMLLRPSRPLGDTLQYDVYIKDQKGNESNRFTTPDIYLVP